MSYSNELKEKAIQLRKKGYSLKEISAILKIAKSTTSVWLNGIILSSSAQKRLKQKQILGQYKTTLLKRKAKELQKQKHEQNAINLFNKISLSKEIAKMCCALLWWCEGNKDDSMVRFTNSDSSLIQNYLSLLRMGFDIDESKLRVLVHLHSYHNEQVQKKFWSSITNIPLTQFHKSYQKENTRKRIHKNYQGCIAITYYDAKIAKELEAIYNIFTRRGVR